jgi:hypothetical protein
MADTYLEELRNHTIHFGDNRPRSKLEPLPLHTHSACSMKPSEHGGCNMCRLLLHESPFILSTECIYGLHIILSPSIVSLNSRLLTFAFCKRGGSMLSQPDAVPARSEAWTVFARAGGGILGSNPTQGMDVWCVNAFFLYMCFPVFSGLRGLEVTFPPHDPSDAGSNPAEVVEFLIVV